MLTQLNLPFVSGNSRQETPSPACPIIHQENKADASVLSHLMPLHAVTDVALTADNNGEGANMRRYPAPAGDGRARSLLVPAQFPL